MLDLWLGFPAWMRMIAALALIGIGGWIVYLWLFGGREVAEYRFLPLIGAGIVAMGFVLVLVGGRSNSERNGYHF